MPLWSSSLSVSLFTSSSLSSPIISMSQSLSSPSSNWRTWLLLDVFPAVGCFNPIASHEVTLDKHLHLYLRKASFILSFVAAASSLCCLFSSSFLFTSLTFSSNLTALKVSRTWVMGFPLVFLGWILRIGTKPGISFGDIGDCWNSCITFSALANLHSYHLVDILW